MTARMAAGDVEESSDVQPDDVDAPTDTTPDEEAGSMRRGVLEKSLREAAEATKEAEKPVPEKKKLKVYMQPHTVTAIKSMLAKNAASKGEKRKRDEEVDEEEGQAAETQGPEVERMRHDDKPSGEGISSSTSDKAVETTTSQTEALVIAPAPPIFNEIVEKKVGEAAEIISNHEREVDAAPVPPIATVTPTSSIQSEDAGGRLKRRRESDSSDGTASQGSKRARIEPSTAPTTPEEGAEEEVEEEEL